MKKITLFVVIASLILTSNICLASGYSDITKAILPYLKTVSGKVISSNGSNFKLNRGYTDGITKHEFVYVYRNRGFFIPPGMEKPVPLNAGVCYGEVTGVASRTSWAKVVSGIVTIPKYLLGIIPTGQKELIGKPKAGDMFIAGKEEYRIAILTRNPVVFKSIARSLTQTKRFFVINPNIIELNRVKDRITSLSSRQSIVKLSRSLNADLLLKIDINPNLTEMSYNLINGYSGDSIVIGHVKLTKQETLILRKNMKYASEIPPNNIVASNLSLTPHLSFWEKLLGKLGLYSPYSPGTSLSSTNFKLVTYTNIGYDKSVLNLGKIGNTTYVFVGSGDRVYTYKVGADSLTRITSFKVGYRVFHIDTADAKNRILLAISSYNSYGSLSSAIGYFDGKSFHPTAKNLRYNVRWYRLNHIIPIGQRASIDAPFYGAIYRLNMDGKPVAELKLPVSPRSLFEFYRIGKSIVYISRSDQLSIYNTETGKHVQINGIFNGNVLSFQRYPSNSITPEEESTIKPNVEIPENLFLSIEKNGTYILTKRVYLTNPIVIMGSHYNAYNLFVFKWEHGKLIRIFSSGNVGGNMISFNKTDSKIIGVLGVPANFMTKLLLGHTRLYRLTIFEMK